MSGFLYFLPECVDPPDLAALAKVGLGYAFEVPPAYTIKGGGSGPGELSGMLVGDGNDLVYDPARQTWSALPIADCRLPIRIGMWNDRPPTPEELVRRKMLPGLSITVGDGREWIVPIARRWVSDAAEGGWFNALPHRWGLDEGGQLPMQHFPLDAWRALKHRHHVGMFHAGIAIEGILGVDHRVP